jgi:polygalacturonase
MIHVHTVDELLASIAPDTSIYLEDGVYNLSDAADYGTDSGEYYSWMLCYDGPGLVIENVQNLSITAAGPHRAGIVAVPRYADVLGFDRCSDITLRGFTAGHTQAQSDCAGGVLNFMGTEDVLVEDCSLYGCGILGVSGYNSRNMTIRTTEIHHCSYGAISLEGCENVSIEQCNIHDIPVSPFQFYDSKNVTVDEKTVQG